MSDRDDWENDAFRDESAYRDDYEERFDPVPPPKQGMSTALKLVILFSVLGLGGVLLCCGGVLFLGRQVQQGATNDPQEIRNRAKDIANLEVPEDYTPAQATDVSGFGFTAMRMVMFKAPGDDGMLMLMQMPIPFEGEGIKQEDIDNAINQQRGEGEGQLEDQQTETREFTINGATVNFMFTTGTQKDTGEVFHTVNGAFPGREKSYVTIFALIIDAENYDEEEVVKMIESIK